MWYKPPRFGQVDISYFGEFGYELMLVVPYAYFLHTKGRLRSTRGCTGTKELYYFSTHHTEEQRQRTLQLPEFAPNFTPHVHHLDRTAWLPPPYKQVYTNARFLYEKPLYIVHNKHAMEWMGKPVNTLSIATLDSLFSCLKRRYQIVYIRPGFTNNLEKGYTNDQNAIQSLPHEHELLTHHHPEVLTIQSILQQNSDLTYNQLQLLLHANCNHFISVQGGNAVLASYFGGQNIILAKMGRELRCGAYAGHYRRYAGTTVIVARSEQDLLSVACA